MADVSTWVAQIRAAIYGEQVRESIAKSIEAMNDDNIETLANYNDTIADVEAATEAANDAAGAATDIKDEVEAKLEHGDFIGATGPRGEAATVAVGSVTTGQPGTAAKVFNSGTDTDAVLDFTIPQGATGNVDNMDTVAITFEPDTTDQNIASGMTLSGLFGRLQGLIGSIRTTLSARDESTLTSAPSISSSDYVRLVESDGDMYKKLVSDVADYILRTYAPSTSGPTSGSVMEKINSLNGKIYQTTSHGLTAASGVTINWARKTVVDKIAMFSVAITINSAKSAGADLLLDFPQGSSYGGIVTVVANDNAYGVKYFQMTGGTKLIAMSSLDANKSYRFTIVYSME